jgi:hypothetical protein
MGETAPTTSPPETPPQLKHPLEPLAHWLKLHKVYVCKGGGGDHPMAQHIARFSYMPE